MVAEENEAMVISGRHPSHPIAIETRVTNDANNTLAINNSLLTISLIIWMFPIKWEGLDVTCNN